MFACSSASRTLCNKRVSFLCQRLVALSNFDHGLVIDTSLPLSRQVRHARKVRDSRPTADGPLGRGITPPPVEEPAEIVVPEVPKSVLDAWDNDEEIQAFLTMFASKELQGKRLMAHRDVAKLFECMGLSREQLGEMISGEGEEFDMDEDIHAGAPKGGQKGGDMRSLGGGSRYESGFGGDDFGGKRGGKGEGKGGGYDIDMGGKGGKGKGGSFDFEDEFGGFRKGGKGMKGKKGSFDDFDDVSDFGSFGKGGKGKRGGFEDFDDDYGSFGKGGKGSRAGSRGGKGRF